MYINFFKQDEIIYLLDPTKPFLYYLVKCIYNRNFVFNFAAVFAFF